MQRLREGVGLEGWEVLGREFNVMGILLGLSEKDQEWEDCRWHEERRL